MGDALTAFNVLFESQMLLEALHTLYEMSNTKRPFYSKTQLKGGMKSGLRTTGFLATADDAAPIYKLQKCAHFCFKKPAGS